MKEIHAVINWNYSSNGKKLKILCGEPFYCHLLLDGNKDSLNWSAKIINVNYLSENKSHSIVQFIFENAPYYLLKPNVKFTIHEGFIIVGEGMILSVESIG